MQTLIDCRYNFGRIYKTSHGKNPVGGFFVKKCIEKKYHYSKTKLTNTPHGYILKMFSEIHFY